MAWRTVAMAMTKVALLEHCTISSSSWIIFLIRDTGKELAVLASSLGDLYALGRALCPVTSSRSPAFFADMTELLCSKRL